jgi:CxxC motif-containing protein (DUF1111 family)
MQRTMRKTTYVCLAVTGVCFLLVTQWWTDSHRLMAAGAENLTVPLADLTAAQRAAFDAGLEEFEEKETPEEGLGPVFNGKSCAECHAVPSVGGSEPNLGVARETRIGGPNGDLLANLGGPLLQQRAIDLPGCNLQGEGVPREATFVSLRISTPLFGAGLIEAIPEATITNRGNGGRPNRVFNPDTKRTELGRFGWKAQVATLHQFSGDAYLNEMGITNPSFPEENRPQGKPLPPGCDTAPLCVNDPTKQCPNDLEDDGSGVTAFENFMKFLAPAPRRPITAQVQRGEQVFSQIGCATCHVPTMKTGANPMIPALSNKDVNLFSDLLLHNIGTGDGIVQGEATGADFRTAPLWGLSRRDNFMHDGKSKTIQDAILRHGAPDAVNALNGFVGLPQPDHDALLAFLGSL